MQWLQGDRGRGREGESIALLALHCTDYDADHCFIYIREREVMIGH